jgi:hypothetical protein
MKWLGISLGVLLLLVGGYAVYTATIANPRVLAELRDSPTGERAKKVMLLSLPSGRTLPVNYLREDDLVYAGSDGPWWRELRGDPTPVSVVILGDTLQGQASAIESDPERTREVFSRLRPSAPSWLPDWMNGVLVEIRLESPPANPPTPRS